MIGTYKFPAIITGSERGSNYFFYPFYGLLFNSFIGIHGSLFSFFFFNI